MLRAFCCVHAKHAVACSYDPAGLANKGATGCTAKKKCTTCEGDCDGDADCSSGLKCFQRNTATVLVPGCGKGGAGDLGTYDYWYALLRQLLLRAAASPRTPTHTCAQCAVRVCACARVRSAATELNHAPAATTRAAW